MKDIDWNNFNWPEIFGTIHAIAPMMVNNQHKFMISDIIERTIARHSDGQFEYVGHKTDGQDFAGTDGLRYECKAMKSLIQKTTYLTKPIILKNFRGDCLGVPDQTFDYMLAVDYTQNTVLMADWKSCLKRKYNEWRNMISPKVSDSNLTIRLDERDCGVLADRVTPKTKTIDIQEKYNDFVASIG